MKLSHLGLVVLIAVLAGFGGGKLASTTLQNNAMVAQESTYDRVLRTDTIRCGYALWPPHLLTKDANTGRVQGAVVDIVEEMGRNLGLKIEWTEETGWGNFIEALESKRFDMFCAPLWQNAQRGKRVNFTVPIAYSALHLYVRKDDHRFDDGLEKLNAPEMKLATMDGEMSQIIANKRFPLAQQVSIPQLGDVTQLLLSVADGKADGVFLEPSLAKDFSAKNMGKIRQATTAPYQVFANTFGILLGEEKFTHMINSALLEMLNQGAIDATLSKHMPDRSIFMPVVKPYTYIEPAPLQ
jgi:ABC-type amino acid transport substrate-binding protein